jgi:hypothetical protein
MKSTLVIGASENPDRYSWMAVNMLKEYGHKVQAIGIRPGRVNGVEILTGQPAFENLHTISLYLSPKHQPVLYSYILKLNPIPIGQFVWRLTHVWSRWNPVLYPQQSRHVTLA